MVNSGLSALHQLAHQAWVTVADGSGAALHPCQVARRSRAPCRRSGARNARPSPDARPVRDPAQDGRHPTHGLAGLSVQSDPGTASLYRGLFVPQPVCTASTGRARVVPRLGPAAKRARPIKLSSHAFKARA
eukprot:102692-Chlamydomonas_euryale.AAC.1